MARGKQVNRQKDSISSAEYLLFQQVFVVDSIPLLVNGKTDRQKLLQMYQERNTANDGEQITHIAFQVILFIFAFMHRLFTYDLSPCWLLNEYVSTVGPTKLKGQITFGNISCNGLYLGTILETVGTQE